MNTQDENINIVIGFRIYCQYYSSIFYNIWYREKKLNNLLTYNSINSVFNIIIITFKWLQFL